MSAETTIGPNWRGPCPLLDHFLRRRRNTINILRAAEETGGTAGLNVLLIRGILNGSIRP